MLRAHCDDAGRDDTTIEKTTATWLDLGDQPREGMRRFIDHLQDLAAIGIDHAIISPRHPWDDATLDLLAHALDDIHRIPSRRPAD